MLLQPSCEDAFNTLYLQQYLRIFTEELLEDVLVG